MARFRRVAALLFVICLYLCSAQHLCSAQQPEPIADLASELQVTIIVYNGVNLSFNDLTRAERKAEKVFLYTGIHLMWRTGLLAAGVKLNAPAVNSTPTPLQLRIWTRAMVAERPAHSDTLGFCLSFENGDAVVLADAIQKRAVVGTTNFADLLGLAMTHELGHLLLRSPTHSVTGIMRARWTERGLAEDDRGYLRFTSRGSRIHAERSQAPDGHEKEVFGLR
jgi:hypothetical protein